MWVLRCALICSAIAFCRFATTEIHSPSAREAREAEDRPHLLLGRAEAWGPLVLPPRHDPRHGSAGRREMTTTAQRLYQLRASDR